MKFQLTVTASIDISDLHAFERFASIDPRTVGHDIQTWAARRLADYGPAELENVTVVVLPLYG